MFFQTQFPNFQSVNKLSDISDGRYKERQDLYLDESGDTRCLVRKFTHESSTNANVVEVLLSEGEALFARDFVQLEDGKWRDSDGNQSLSLLELMPDRLDGLRLVESLEYAGEVEVLGDVKNG